MLQTAANKSKSLGLEINLDKTKLIVIDRSNTVQLNNLSPNIETAHELIFFGSPITNTGGCEEEIERGIKLSRVAVVNLWNILVDKEITKTAKIPLVRSLAFSIFS